jgi:hypothetical protein
MTVPEPRIACIGYSTDDTFAHTVERIEILTGSSPVLFDLAKVDESGFWFDYTGQSCEFRMGDGETFEFTPGMAVFQRLIRASASLQQDDPRRAVLACAEYAAAALLESDFFLLVVNPLSAGWDNSIRPLHYRFLASHGLRVPDYLITSDPEEARVFLARHAQVHVKSAGHQRTIARRLTPERRCDLDAIAHCPSVLQESISGPDVRVHVVAGDCFALQITSNSEDYRYSPAGENLYVEIEVPPDIASQCIAATGASGLAIAGLDFKVSNTSDDWYCLEMNPMPGYSGYDRRLGGRLSEALVDFMRCRI